MNPNEFGPMSRITPDRGLLLKDLLKAMLSNTPTVSRSA